MTVQGPRSVSLIPFPVLQLLLLELAKRHKKLPDVDIVMSTAGVDLRTESTR